MKDYFKSIILLCFMTSRILTSGVIVPLYIYPTISQRYASYNGIVNLNKLYPKVKIVVIVNPDNGHGTSENFDYSSTIVIFAS